LQTLVEIGVDKNTMVIIPAPLMSTIQEVSGFLAREGSTLPAAAPAPTAVEAVPDHGANGEPARRR
jgi:hypothetical protein